MRPLRTLHVCYSFPPDPAGGTEVYVEGLCRALETMGVQSRVAAPAFCDASYETHGLQVRRFAADQSADLDALYAGDPVAAASFARLLDEGGVDLVHLHALTPACSPVLAHEVKRRDLPLVFTLHTPTATCTRGTLLEQGTRVCDGRVEVRRCAACVLDGLGTGPLSGVLAAVPLKGGRMLGWLGKHGGAWTALRMSSLIGHRAEGLAQLFSDVDRFIVLTGWVDELLRANGVAADKLVHSPHGIGAPAFAAGRERPAGSTLRVAHLGRVDPAKGTAFLIRALKAAPSADIELDIYAVDQQGGATLQELVRLSADDSRVHWPRAIASAEVVERLAQYDLLAVPSQGLETGPLVVLEAFAAGVPVLGSAIGGVADKVTDGVNGMLVQPFDSESAWAEALQLLAADRAAITRLAAGVRPPRSMDAVAQEMRAVYSALIGDASRRRVVDPDAREAAASGASVA